MSNSSIWAVIFAKPPNGSLRALFDERMRIGADMMYVRRFRHAKAMAKADRVVVLFGGPQGSDPDAQYLVKAGCVAEPARPITPQDAQTCSRLLDLTCVGFPLFQRDAALLGQQGIMFYRLFDPPAGIGRLPRPFPQAMRGQNFIKLLPSDPWFSKIDDWWSKVVPRGHCGNG